MKVFLGGTCNDSKWRDDLIEMLEIDYFNPVVEDWTPECMKEEEKQRKNCDFCLYVLTPKMTGVYSVAEGVDDSNKRPEKTILCILEEDDKDKFDEHQMKSMGQVLKMVEENGGKAVKSLKSVATYLNTKGKIE